MAQRERVFCISMQRTGTTSTGQFLRDFGYACAGWPHDKDNGWSRAWYRGDYEAIFKSFDFVNSNAFEDSPWFMPGFYRILHHRFPGSKFILFTRDPDAWFDSLCYLTGGDFGGNKKIHFKVYRREAELFSEKQQRLDQMREHYKDVYQLHTDEILDFFKLHAPGSLFHGELEDPEKWQKLGKFLGIKVPKHYNVHINKRKTQ